jgi:hypothetical protein
LFSFEAIEKLANYGKAARNFLKEVSWVSVFLILLLHVWVCV